MATEKKKILNLKKQKKQYVCEIKMRINIWFSYILEIYLKNCKCKDKCTNNINFPMANYVKLIKMQKL